MGMEQATEANMKIILDELADDLNVVNRTIMDPEDYDLDKYADLKMMYDHVKSKDSLSPSETQAFITELSSMRKK